MTGPDIAMAEYALPCKMQHKRDYAIQRAVQAELVPAARLLLLVVAHKVARAPVPLHPELTAALAHEIKDLHQEYVALTMLERGELKDGLQPKFDLNGLTTSFHNADSTHQSEGSITIMPMHFRATSHSEMAGQAGPLSTRVPGHSHFGVASSLLDHLHA